ncbi:universal stress protein [Streptomyces sp. NTH33]|uniref:universal stress protein n=1 Tax=Streptomyces sp. NTH33 TaxID=1735453 RepID=UPI0034D97E5F
MGVLLASGRTRPACRRRPDRPHRRTRSPSSPASYETEAAAMQPVVTVGLDGSPESLAQAVVQAAEGAVLLAVGRRRHRPAPAPHLGPVAQAALHHGRCPVAVVPHG